jgi:hypothetical protein
MLAYLDLIYDNLSYATIIKTRCPPALPELHDRGHLHINIFEMLL